MFDEFIINNYDESNFIESLMNLKNVSSLFDYKIYFVEKSLILQMLLSTHLSIIKFILKKNGHFQMLFDEKVSKFHYQALSLKFLKSLLNFPKTIFINEI